MGSSNSKTQGTATIQKNDLDKDIGGNPDPRSPTPEITRTPLQVYLRTSAVFYINVLC